MTHEADIHLDLSTAQVAAEICEAELDFNLSSGAVNADVGDLLVSLALDSPALLVESQAPSVQILLDGPRGVPGPPGNAVIPIYVGPLIAAPQNPAVPTLLILREPGAAADQTALVVREPTGG